jgi:7,8-dihydropterin-6-yl-methyl-4-(beta-D-ribofuranosyl)aminobenzene 5'-phosphate synthase
VVGGALRVLRITILHDAFGKPSGMRKEWGFAALVEDGGRRVLFDTGNNAATFAANCEALGVDLARVDFAVISHRHGDHTSGISHLLKRNPRLTIYTPDETYGVFGSSLFGGFYPRCHTLPRYFQYYDGDPPEVIRHGTPWPEASFVWIKEATEVAPAMFVVPVVSDVPGTRELRELSLVIRGSSGLVLVVGCSHPGIEKIIEAVRAIDGRIACIIGGLHLVLTEEREVRRTVTNLRDKWHVERIAPGHCTGEPAFAAIREIFGDRCLFAGLGERVEL